MGRGQSVYDHLAQKGRGALPSEMAALWACPGPPGTPPFCTKGSPWLSACAPWKEVRPGPQEGWAIYTLHRGIYLIVFVWGWKYRC